MSKLPVRAAWKLALILSASGLAAAAVGSTAWAIDASHSTPAMPPTDVTAGAGDSQAPLADDNAPLLPDRPDLATVTGNVLGPMYINHSAGIEFHVPLGSRKVLQVSQDILAEFDDPARHWELKVAMVVRESPTVLTTNSALNPSVAASSATPTTHPSAGPSAAKPTDGLMEKTLELLKRSLPEAKVLREDLTSLPNGNSAIENNVGLLFIRYTAAGQRRLAQQALIQAGDRVFYVLTLTSPGKPEESSPGDDPREIEAVNTFRKVLDSVILLDRGAIRRDQENRLYSTRTLFVNLTPERLKAALIPEQWLRVIHDGKDVGYTYICEQQAGDIPRLGQQNPPTDERETPDHMFKPMIPPGNDILIGIRSRLFTDGLRRDKTTGSIIIDNESWLFCGIERNREEWSRETLIDDRLKGPDGKPNKPQFIEELGDSNKRLKEALVPPPPDAPFGSKPQMQTVTDYKLDVEDVNTGAALPPLTRQLPPFYTPQAISHLMPRLLPLHEPRGYLFAEYVGDVREVMMRYMDVLPRQPVNILGKTVIAIPIDDRIGLDGTVTTHYFTPAGQYLGSETRDTDTWVLPSTNDAIEKFWANNALLAVPHAIANHHGEAAAQ